MIRLVWEVLQLLFGEASLQYYVGGRVDSTLSCSGHFVLRRLRLNLPKSLCLVAGDTTGQELALLIFVVK